jgi:hypothetical protein
VTPAIASLGTLVAYLPLATVGIWGAAALGFTGVMMMASVHSPARAVLSQELVAHRWRTTTSAILIIGTALGWATTAAAGGYTITTLGFTSRAMAPRPSLGLIWEAH